MSDALVSPPGRILYVHNLYKARRFKNDPNNPAKFQCALVILKNDPRVAAMIETYNIDATSIEGTTPSPVAGAPAVLPFGKKSCLMDGAVRHPGDAFYSDKYILSASKAEEDGQPQLLLGPGQPLMDKGDLYSGADALLHLRFYTYKGGSGGINAELIGVMKVGDNEKLGHTDPDSSDAFATAMSVQPVAVQPAPTPPFSFL